jgi:ribose/xylose/arabinose/galactoside ABC-type transport system permease subunit
MTLVIASGGIDLSVGAQIALATVTLATLLARGWSPAAALLATVAGGAACGCLIGGLVTGLRLPPFIVTLGMWGGLRGLAKGLAGETMVVAPTTWLNDLLTALPPDRRWLLVPSGVWLTILLAVAVAVLLQATRLGRHILATGSNESTARLCGVSVDRTKLTVYAFASALAAVAGILQYAYLTVGDPTTALGMELDIIAAVVIGGASLSGGRGSVAGTLVGAMIMTAVANGCTKLDLPNWVQEIVTGVIIVSAVALDRFRRDDE